MSGRQCYAFRQLDQRFDGTGRDDVLSGGARSRMHAMVQPVLLAIDDDESLLGDIERELHDRYARHYQVVCVRSPAEARAHLRDFAASGVEVALVLAARSHTEVPTSELLVEVRQFHPRAKRALVVAFGDWGQKAVGDEIFEGVADGRFDHYVLRPAASPDELRSPAEHRLASTGHRTG